MERRRDHLEHRLSGEEVARERGLPDGPLRTGGAIAASHRSWRALYFDAAAFVSRGLWIGFLCGALIGGLGGRLAMFILRLTSDDSVRGLETDDGFAIGDFTGETAFLVIFTAVLGAAGALLYLPGREWLPHRARAPLSGLLFGTLGGAIVIEPGSIDFTLLEPLWLAVAMFIALPALYGIALSAFIEQRISHAATSERQKGLRGWFGVLPLGLLLVGGPFGVAVALVGAIVVAVNRTGALARAWCSMPAVWVGRVALTAAMGVGAFELLDDVTGVL